MKKYLISLILFSSFSCENDTPDPIPNPDPIEYSLTLNISPDGGGTLSKSSGVFNENEIVSVLATANENYNFDSWTGSVISNNNPLSITMDSDKIITANFTEIELCEIDYSTLHTGINTLTSHYQPMNIPFVDYAKQINAVSNIENINTYQLWHQHLNINGNNIPDQILVEVDHNTEINGLAHVFIDNEFAYSFGNESHAIRQLEIGDLDGNGTDDAIFISTGIDREPFTGDPIVAVYLSTSGAEIDIVAEKRSYRHAGSLGDLDGDGDLDLIAIDNLQFQNGNGMEEILWYENNGKGTWVEKKTNIPNIFLQNTYQIELFDLNNDGILDLIGGTSEWRAEWFDNVGLPVDIDERTKIILGQGNGQFNWENPIVIEPINNWGVITDLDFYDLDNDGYNEIIVTRTSGPGTYQEGTYYNGFKIQILKGVNNEYNTTHVLEMPINWGSMWIYNSIIYDVNNDCILDIIPENDRTIVDAYFEGTSNFEYELKYKD
jgi:hypothetical protein